MTTPCAHYFQHVAFEGLGSMEAWLTNKSYAISSTRFCDHDYQLPSVDTIDLLIIMGGPMSVNDESIYPWLTEEKQFIRDYLVTGNPLVGICLGAQLIASALGASVYPNPEPEIGWYPVFACENSQTNAFEFPTEHTAFHWHGETFDLPDGATRLARSHGCKNQAFQLRDNIIGLQFHLETTARSAQDLVKFCGDEIVPGTYVQSVGQILFPPAGQYKEINGMMGQVLEFVIGSGA